MKSKHKPRIRNRFSSAGGWFLGLGVVMGCVPVVGVQVATSQEEEGRGGKIVGEVFDSTRARPLVSAEVLLEGTDYRAATDRTGRFSIEGIRPGEYRLTFRHPRVALLNYEFRPIHLVVEEGSSLRMNLGLPSTSTLRERVCDRPLDPQAPGFLSGVIRSGAGPARGLGGAIVEGSWTAGGSLGVQRAVSDRSGRYVLCDLPIDTEIAFRAGKGKEAATPTGLTLGEGEFKLLDFAVYPRVRTRIVGRVMDYDSGEPVEGAVVRLAKTGNSTITANSGRFVLDDVNVGRYRFEVEHLTYGVTADSLEVGPSTADVEVLLSPRAIQLEGITVFSRPKPLENVGFYNREIRGLGRYISRHEILRRNPNRLSDMLQATPGIQLTVGAGSEYGVLLRNRCEPTFIVDGHHFPRSIFRIDDIHPSLIHGVEIYSSVAQIPAEYRQPRFEQGGTTPETPCGVILIWTGPASWDGSGDRVP